MPARDRASSGYIGELDGLRGIAILLVMIHRMYPRSETGTPWPIEAGWAGVDLFFVISGFLIAGILIDAREAPDYFRNFYARRILRIFPLFYLFVGGMLLVFPLTNGDFLHQAGSPLWYLLQLGNLPEAVLGLDPPYWLAPVWSLAIEEQFYLTFPLLVRWCDPRRLARWLTVIAVLALACRVVTTALVPGLDRMQYMFTLCRLDTIAIGCLLAVFVRSERYQRWRPHLPRVLVPVIAVSAAVLIATQLDRTTWFGRTLGYDVVAIGFVALVLLVLELRDQPATAALRVAPLRYLGKLCFGLYLLHRPADTLVIALVERAGLDATRLAWLPVKLAVAVGLATLSWRIIERPFLRLKQRFSARPRVTVPRAALMLSVLALVACEPSPATGRDATQGDASGDISGTELDAGVSDARTIAIDAPPPTDAPADAPPPLGRVLYPEDRLVSPIPGDVAAALAQIADGPGDPRVFAKIGDSMTATESFVACFEPTPALGARSDLATSLAYFRAGDAAGTTPYARPSLAAKGGWTTADVLAGQPSPLARELAAVTPRYGLVLLGTNDVRYGRTVDAFGADLWTLVDQTIAAGTIPILSTMPAMHGDPGANARIPLFNRVIRAIAQGRSLPLADLHRALAPLANEGLTGDGIHPTAAPAGACALTDDALAYGYNQRNLLALDSLDRTRRAVGGEALDASAPRRLGRGTQADPFRGQLPLVDLGDTRTGESRLASYSGCGLTASGHELVYRLELAAATTIDAYVVDRDAVDVDVAILDGSLAPAACVAAGDHAASATVGPGPVFVIVDSRAATTEGEAVVVVQAR